MMYLPYVAIAVIAYLMGSFSTGLLVAKIHHGPNLRQVGSKNTGASNVLRTMGLKSGAITFLGDFLKALLACVIGLVWMGHKGVLVAGLFAVIGHNWPVYYGFKGGKGVASTCAVILMGFWWQALICYGVTIGLIAKTKYISLGSMTLAGLYAVLVTITAWGDWMAILWAWLLVALCVWRHRANIRRLLNGTEAKIGQKAK
ncbi:MAG: glycerol-3-phosphate 1-O-acyltransferase PlsY [Clostridiales bacterium]|nr:glycerol-3-phosphate 1-O-acyltransferase PlsY [Clostridiales bacterium]